VYTLKRHARLEFLHPLGAFKFVSLHFIKVIFKAFKLILI
jgi:hypothetical protein